MHRYASHCIHRYLVFCLQTKQRRPKSLLPCSLEMQAGKCLPTSLLSAALNQVDFLRGWTVTTSSFSCVISKSLFLFSDSSTRSKVVHFSKVASSWEYLYSIKASHKKVISLELRTSNKVVDSRSTHWRNNHFHQSE